MTNYGTIPTSSPPEGHDVANLDYVTRAKNRIKEGLTSRRPWKLMFDFHFFNFPRPISHAASRIRTNISFFRMNYAVIVLLILFLSLLWHPISLIVFVVLMAVWLFLYFLRDDSLVIFGRQIDDRIVLAVLTVLTIGLLLLTHATLNVVLSVAVGLVVILIHAAIRKTDDLFLDEEDTAGLLPPRIVS